jgi:hypothetical protein
MGMDADTRARLICSVEFPAHLEFSYNDAVDERNLRVWLWERHKVTVPGEIEIEVVAAGDGGWTVAIRETG